MAHRYVDMKLVIILYVSWIVPLCYAQPFKAVNLGNWLVTEGWMKPDLFDGIPNNDLLVTLTSTYVCEPPSSILIADNLLFIYFVSLNQI